MPSAPARRQHGAPAAATSTHLPRHPPHVPRLSPPPLRTADGHDREERRASWLELFFDLVVAGAVGQLAGALQDHPSLTALARFAMGLVFMGAIVLPVYLVPALTLVLALGLAAETHPDRWPALMRRRHSGHFGRGNIRPGLRHHQVAAS